MITKPGTLGLVSVKERRNRGRTYRCDMMQNKAIKKTEIKVSASINSVRREMAARLGTYHTINVSEVSKKGERPVGSIYLSSNGMYKWQSHTTYHFYRLSPITGEITRE